MMLNKISVALILVILFSLTIWPKMQQYKLDVSQNRIHQLTDNSKLLLDKITEPLKIEIYTPDVELLNHAKEILDPYAQYNQNVKISFNLASLSQVQAKQYHVNTLSNLLIEYGSLKQGVDITYNTMNEKNCSTVIQQIVNTNDQWIVFLTGHGEANPFDTSEMGLSKFAALFSNQGFKIAQLNLLEEQQIPRNTGILIVANPEKDFSEQEKEILHTYIESGGEVLWFTEPASVVKQNLQQEFGVTLADGVIIDPHSQSLGSPHPAIKIITAFPEHAVSKNLNLPIIMPWSGHLITTESSTWQSQAFIKTAPQTWTYNDLANPDISTMLNNKDLLGPLTIGLSLERQYNNILQRCLIIADSSFILNKYLPLHGNAKLAANMLSWLHPETTSFIYAPIPPKDLNYYPSPFVLSYLKYGSTLVIPISFILIGLWLRRMNTRYS